MDLSFVKIQSFQENIDNLSSVDIALLQRTTGKDIESIKENYDNIDYLFNMCDVILTTCKLNSSFYGKLVCDESVDINLLKTCPEYYLLFDKLLPGTDYMPLGYHDFEEMFTDRVDNSCKIPLEYIKKIEYLSKACSDFNITDSIKSLFQLFAKDYSLENPISDMYDFKYVCRNLTNPNELLSLYHYAKAMEEIIY